MNRKPERGLFVTGTDTGVGKTYVAAGIARALRAAGRNVGVYKPVASGCPRRGSQLENEDAVQLWEAAGRPLSVQQVCPQAFAAPLAPHLAARAEERELDETLLRSGLDAWHATEIVIVEGAGGLMSPVGDELYVADLAFEFGYPLVIVAPNQIGVINQTLQTLIAAVTFRDGLPIAGIVLNDRPLPHDDPSCRKNATELAARCVPPLLAHVPLQGEQRLASVDWFAASENPVRDS